jgi:enolase-phosphatase E1
VAAQKLLFQHTDSEMKDMTPLFSGYYDTVNAGMKQEAASYVKIAKAEEEAGLGDEGKWLFCSDMVRGKFSSGAPGGGL